MTQIDFYTHVAQPLKLAAKIIAKAYRMHGSVRVLTPDADTTQALDRLLWLDPPLSFLPHCRMDSAVAAETPIWIDERLEHAGPGRGPAEFARGTAAVFQSLRTPRGTGRCRRAQRRGRSRPVSLLSRARLRLAAARLVVA
jgi:hypothetical protein